MTPEQEILEDALIAARQRCESFRNELRNHAASLPISEAWRYATILIDMVDRFVADHRLLEAPNAHD